MLRSPPLSRVADDASNVLKCEFGLLCERARECVENWRLTINVTANVENLNRLEPSIHDC